VNLSLRGGEGQGWGRRGLTTQAAGEARLPRRGRARCSGKFSDPLGGGCGFGSGRGDLKLSRWVLTPGSEVPAGGRRCFYGKSEALNGSQPPKYR